MNQERRDPREDFQQDAFVDSMLRAWDAISRNRALVIGMLVVVAVAILGSAAYLRSRSLHQADSQVLVNRAVAYFDAEDFGRATEWFTRAIEEYDGTEAALDAHYFLGMIALRQERFAEAKEELEHYLHVRSRADFMEAAAHGGLAVCAEREGDWETAAREWTRAGMMDAANFRASTHLLNAALSWEKAGRYQDGIRLLDRLLEKYPASSEKTRAEVARARMLRMQ